jgi:uncharacterized membrane protein YqiK
MRKMKPSKKWIMIANLLMLGAILCVAMVIVLACMGWLFSAIAIASLAAALEVVENKVRSKGYELKAQEFLSQLNDYAEQVMKEFRSF